MENIEKEVIKEVNETFKVKNQEEYKKTLKQFTITIKDNSTGEMLVNEETNAILGVYARINEDKKMGIDGMAVLSALHCNSLVRLSAIDALNELVNEMKKLAVTDAMKNLISALGGKNE